tara:strand:+ start:210 stop:407 length:198 start_codon:yes stop_codon:yes gene_type:complete
MTLRTHTVKKKNPKHSQEWSWEETPEVLAAIEQLHKSSELVKSIKVPNLNVGSNTVVKSRKSVVK